MRFIVTIKVGGEDKKTPEIRWAPQIIEAEDRWGALVKAVEAIGLDKKLSMSYLWKRASIIKEKREDIRRFRVREELVKSTEVSDEV